MAPNRRQRHKVLAPSIQDGMSTAKQGRRACAMYDLSQTPPRPPGVTRPDDRHSRPGPLWLRSHPALSRPPSIRPAHDIHRAPGGGAVVRGGAERD